MSCFRLPSLLAAAIAGSALWFAPGQAKHDPAAAIAAQKEAMARFSFMDGEWRGSAWTLLPTGEKVEITQTERAGPFLDGAVRVVEGRGYEADGSVGFNALGILSFDLATKSYKLRSYAQGRSGDFDVTPDESGFTWTIPAGPATIRYTATVKDGTWTEVGDHLAPGRDPVRFFEMNLVRIGDSDWPAADPVAME